MSTETQQADFSERKTKLARLWREINGGGTRWPPDVDDFINAMLKSTQSSQAAEIEALRRLLCAVYAGFSAYADDGECQDNSAYPHIDFLRDTPEQIESKMRERAFARVANLQTKEAS